MTFRIKNTAGIVSSPFAPRKDGKSRCPESEHDDSTVAARSLPAPQGLRTRQAAPFSLSFWERAGVRALPPTRRPNVPRGTLRRRDGASCCLLYLCAELSGALNKSGVRGQGSGQFCAKRASSSLFQPLLSQGAGHSRLSHSPLFTLYILYARRE
jgi:hypothetical protein